MSLVKPFDKLPTLNSATILLVGTDESQQQQLAEAILKEKKTFKINIHVATSLPLPAERDHIRPRIDLIAFMINMQSKHSLRNVEASLSHMDANFFLGKVCFLITGENLDCVISCESQACKGPKLPEDDLVLATCPHVNGALKHAGPAGRGDFSKRKPVFQGGTGSDVIELSGLSARNEERDHGFPLPATELGATVLVTTKTIQNNCLTEERP
ncbi:hypothetical protein KIL84_017957 [Mauremys mutica]|uniref:Centromere protein M n=1 Tax=Mauremys mutica TaxID=74926 RepID=A0A9D3XSB6_9SAUR|nr:hypothetical protein KIL84_017957 [Mauremys mutica]